MDNINELYSRVSQDLAKWALALPPYALTKNDILEINTLLSAQDVDVEQIEQKVLSIVIHPRMRAGIFKHRLLAIPEFRSLTYRIDCAYLAFCRGNKPGSISTMLSVIEGMLRCWIESVGEEVPRNPRYKTLSKFVLSTLERNSTHAEWRVPLIKAWAETCNHILSEHLFKDHSQETYYENFNRHVISHDLKELDYRENGVAWIKRAFLVIDLIIELYVVEKNLPVSIFYDVPDDDLRFNAYISAITYMLRNPMAPENIIDRLYQVD